MNQPECMPYNQAYAPLNLNSGPNTEQIDTLRKRLLQNMSELNSNKHIIKTGDYNQLMNYHTFSLNILNNMLNIKHVEMSNHYNINMRSVTGGQAQPGIETINPYEKNLQLIYSNDGKTQIINSNEQNNRTKQEWEIQFDENIINPPSYIIPPSNQWNLPRKQ